MLIKLQPKKRKYDVTLLTALLFLVAFGLIILYSTSAYNGEVKFHDSFYYLKKQAFATILGVLLMLFVAGIDYHIWDGCVWADFVFSILNLRREL